MVVTISGLADMKAVILNAFSETYRWFGVGEGSSAETSEDNDLESPIEVWEGSKIYRKEVDSIYTDGINIIWVCRIGQGEFNKENVDINIREIGIFNAQTGGVMVVRKVLPTALVKNNNKEYVLLVKLKLWEV